jgi:Glycosyl transferases group 1
VAARDRAREWLLRRRTLRSLWGRYRRSQLHRRYEARREHYAREANQRGLVYCEADVARLVRARLAARGPTPVPRPPGEIHTFAFIPQIGWHPALLGDLCELGPVTLFDYAELGFEWEEFYRAKATGRARRRAMNAMVLPALREAHARRAVDWVFVYASGGEISADTIRRITEDLGIPVVNMCLDDKQSWTGAWMGDHRAGQIDIAATFDLSWTSARVACEWYLVEGARPLYMPEGFDGSTFHPVEVPQDIPVSFIGGAYGFRPAVIEFLRRRGIPVQTFGPGWGTRAVWGAEQVDVINRSVVNLGMGGIGYSEDLTNVKTRDFEIPGTGGGLYLTSFNADLAQHFVVGEEIACYRSREEMLELIRHYLRYPNEARSIVRRARDRCLSEHRWLHRYRRVCQILGILAEGPDGVTAPGMGWSEHRREVSGARYEA